MFECAGDVDTFVPGDLQGSLNDIFIEREGGGGEGQARRNIGHTWCYDDLSVKSQKAAIQELWQPYFLTVEREGCCAKINKYIRFTCVKAHVHNMIYPTHYIV